MSQPPEGCLPVSLVGERQSEPAHAAPSGQDRARVRSASRSVFAGVRLRTNVAKRARVRKNALYLVFKIVQRLGQHWRVLNGGATVMSLVLAGARFRDGVLVQQQPGEEVQAA